MKIIGDKSIFAFQYEAYKKIDEYVYGHLAIWVNEKLLGNFSGYSTLSISVSFLEDFLSEYPRRTYEDSEYKKSTEIFFKLYDFFYDEKSLKTGEYLLGEYRQIFWLDEIGEYSFRDLIGIILLNEPNAKRQRLIWKYFDTGVIEEFFLPFDYFDNTSQLFLKDYQNTIIDLKM